MYNIYKMVDLNSMDFTNPPAQARMLRTTPTHAAPQISINVCEKGRKGCSNDSMK